MAVEFISDTAHYDRVIARVSSVKRSLWIGTADIKDLHVKAGNTTEPFLGVLAKLLRLGGKSASSTPRSQSRHSEVICPNARFFVPDYAGVMSTDPFQYGAVNTAPIVNASNTTLTRLNDITVVHTILLFQDTL